MTYFEILIHFRKLGNLDWKKVEEHFEKEVKLLETKTSVNMGTSNTDELSAKWFKILHDVFLRHLTTKFFGFSDKHKLSYKVKKLYIIKINI